MAPHLVPVKLLCAKTLLFHSRIFFPFSFFSLSHTVPPVVTFKKKSHHKYYNHSFLIFFLFSFPQHRSSQSNNLITITNFRIIHFTITNLKKNQKKCDEQRRQEGRAPARRRRGRPGTRAPPEGGPTSAPPEGRLAPARHRRAGRAPAASTRAQPPRAAAGGQPGGHRALRTA